MGNSTCNLAQCSLVRRWCEADGVGGEIGRQRQIWIERRLRVLERDRSNKPRVIPEGVGELARKLEATRAGSRHVHDVGPLLAGHQREERLCQIVDVCR